MNTHAKHVCFGATWATVFSGPRPNWCSPRLGAVGAGRRRTDHNRAEGSARGRGIDGPGLGKVVVGLGRDSHGRYRQQACTLCGTLREAKALRARSLTDRRELRVDLASAVGRLHVDHRWIFGAELSICRFRRSPFVLGATIPRRRK